MNINNSFINVIRDKRIKDIYGNDLILFILYINNFFLNLTFISFLNIYILHKY
jgi:hypothetical protein